MAAAANCDHAYRVWHCGVPHWDKCQSCWWAL